MSKPRSRQRKRKADFEQTSNMDGSNAQTSVTTPSPARNQTAIQRQLERQLEFVSTEPKPVLPGNVARATQQPIPAPDNKRLRNGLFIVITLFFGGLAFWLGLQFANQANTEAPQLSTASQNSPEPLVAEAVAATAVVATQSTSSPQTGPSLESAQTSEALAPTPATADSALADASTEPAKALEDTVPAAEPNTDANTGALAATAIATASAVVARQSTSSTQAEPLTRPIESTQASETLAPTPPSADSAVADTSSEPANTLEDTAPAAEPNTDTNTAALAATAIATATTVVATQSTSSTQAGPSPESAQASVAMAPTPAAADSTVLAAEQATIIEKTDNEAIDRFLQTYSKQSNRIIQSNIIYPRRALKLRQEGKVVIETLVDRNGKVLDMSVLEDPGHKLLVRAVKQAIKKSRNLAPLPADFAGENFRMTIPIVFKLPEAR